MKTEVFRHGVERLVFAVPLRRPVSVPDAAPVEAGARHAGTLAIQAFFVPEALAFRVRQSGMREIEILYGPGGFVAV